MTIGAVCKALDAGVPGHLDLQDPLPGGPEAAHAAAHAGRLPALLAGRRGAPAHDPAPAARRVPAAARDPPGAGGRAPGDATPAGARASDGAPAGAAPRRRDGRATAARCYSLEDVLEDTGAEPKLVRELEEYGVIKGEVRGGVDATTTRPSARSSARSPSWRATASAGATCACSAPRPTARRRCCSRSSPRRCARATPSGARRPSRRSRTSRPSRRTSSTCCSIRDLRKIAR